MLFNRPAHHLVMLRILMRALLLSGVLLQSMLLSVSQAQVVTAIRPDGTLGTAVTQNGNVYNITGGTRPGNGRNLFHSFDRFSVGTNDIASFGGATGIENILSRVTGGQRSDIYGRLQSPANLFLLNPSGVLFGPNASLDVSGSFHVSTADYLGFADGAKFFANLSQESVLTMAAPAAFGFLGPNPAPITVQGSSLRVAAGEILSVVGGDMTILRGTLSAPSGRLQLVSVASPGEVVFSPLELAPELQVDSFARLGRIELSQGALVDASGNGGGTVLIRGGRLLVDRSEIFADNPGDLAGTGLGLDVRIAADAIIANRAALTTDSGGAGHARDLRITAGNLQVINDALIGSRAWASGDAGRVFVSTPTLTMDNTGLIQAGVRRGSGNAGSVEVRAGRITLTRGAQISGSTDGAGRGGDVTVVASDAISITGRGRQGNSAGVVSNTFRLGDGGRVFVSAPILTIEDRGTIQATAANGSNGNAGSVEVRAGRITLTGGAQILTSTFGTGRSGDVTVIATDMIAIAGRDMIGAPSGLFSRTHGRGRGGDLHVEALHIQLSDNGIISADSTGDGEAGTISIQASETFRSQNGRVATQTTGSGGGMIALRAGRLVQLLDSEITTSVRGGGGDAGNIAIDSPSVRLEGSQIIANAFGGRGGNIRIASESFHMDPASRLDASSDQGLQGTVDIGVLSETFALLPQTFVSAAALLPARCAARLSGGNTSSLVLAGRSGLRLDPGGLLPSPLVFDERLVAGEPRQHPPTARFALLAADDKVFPRVLGGSWQGGPPAALNWGCSK